MSALNAFSTIIRPVVSEKSTLLGDQGKYVFEVAVGANKPQIAQAVEKAFNVQIPQADLRRMVNLAGVYEVVKEYAGWSE